MNNTVYTKEEIANLIESNLKSENPMQSYFRLQTAANAAGFGDLEEGDTYMALLLQRKSNDKESIRKILTEHMQMKRYVVATLARFANAF